MSSEVTTSNAAAALTPRQRFGWLAMLPGEVFRHLRWWFGLRCYGIYLRPLVYTPHIVAVPGFSLRIFQRGEAEELLRFAKRPELELTAEVVNAALAKGDICNAIIHDDEIVAFDWYAFSIAPARVADGVYVEFAAHCRYGYFAYTLPEFRGRHLLRAFLPEKDNYCLQRGYSHSIAFIALDNLSSIHYSTAIGNKRIGFAGFLQRGARFIPFRSPAVARLGFGFFRP